MVKQIGLLLLLMVLAYSSAVLADMRFSVTANKRTLVLGEPLTVELKAEAAAAALSSINLEKLKQDFNVFGVSSSMQTQTLKGRYINHETMTLTLYPLRSGKLLLPALSFMHKSSRPLNISVAESGKQVSRVIFKVAIDTPEPLVRQAVTLTLDIYDDGALQWSAPRELIAAGMHQVKLAESQFEETTEGMRYTVHRYAWSLMPLREGKLVVEFPLLDALKLGTRLRYPVPPLTLNVTAVPSYVPVHVPVGELQITREPLPDEIALERPVNWQFKIQGRGLTAEGLQKLLTLPTGDQSIRFYPAKIAKSADERPVSALQTWTVTLPFVPLRSGRVSLPEINLPYFDTRRARIESVVIAESSVHVFNPLWQAVLKIALGVLLLASIVVVTYVLWNKLQQSLRLRKSLLSIVRADTAYDLQRALMSFAVQEGAGSFATMQQWLNYMRQIYQIDDVLLIEVVSKLESDRYGASAPPCDIKQLSLTSAMILKRYSIKTV